MEREVFTYWDGDDSVDYDLTKGSKLTAEEAQVLATLDVAQALRGIETQLKDLMYLLQNHSLPVSVEPTNEK